MISGDAAVGPVSPAELAGAPADRLRAGMDEAAFEAFYGATALSLWRFVRHALGSATEADDVVQEAFLKFLRSSPPLADDARRAYLFRIAGNLVVDRQRKAARDRRLPAAAPSAGPSPSDPATRVDLARVFGQLRPRERMLLWLAYVEEEAHREIGQALGLREGSVRVLLSRARGRLADLMRRHGWSERASGSGRAPAGEGEVRR
jgi:RNA polymerase sigma-70 factor (ECF subfamily)